MKRKDVVQCLVAALVIFLVPALGIGAAPAKTKVSVWEWLSTQGEGPVINAVIEDYAKKNPNVEIERLPTPWPPAHDKLLMMSMANEMPDLIAVNRNWLVEFGSMGMLEDLTPYIDSVPGMRAKYFEPVRGELDGKVLIVPYSGGNSALVYNKKVFAQKGLTPPKTLDEFMVTARKLTDPSKQEYGIQLGMSEKNSTGANVCNFGPLLYTFGGKYVENRKAAFNSDAGVKTMQWMIDLEKVQKVAAPGTISVDPKAMRESLAGGKTFMSFDGAWGTPFYSKFTDLDIGIAQMPKGAKTGTVINIMCWGISKTSKNKQAAWDLLAYICNDANMLKLSREANALPIIRKQAELPEFQAKFKGFTDTLAASDNFFQTGSIPQETELYNIIVAAYQEAFLGTKTAKAALDDAAVKYNQVLAKFYAAVK
ncbi:MAG: sugar ABC transporter substrate-binding protein [Spirochaetota bacterium]